jgi:hypothetical protein
LVGIIRIDVDNLFDWGSFRTKVLNYLAMNYRFLYLRLRKLGYLKHTRKLFDDLAESDIPCIWFFRVETLPSRAFGEEVLQKCHEPALHATNTRSLASFQQELNKIKSCFRKPINGFSKHGSGVLKLSRFRTLDIMKITLLIWGRRVIYISSLEMERYPQKNRR